MCRAFIAIICLMGVTYAQKKGYNYQIGLSDSDLSAPSSNNIGGGAGDNDGSFDSASYTSSADFEKEFYTFSAPDNEFDNPDAIQKMLDTMRRNVRVVFIKGPDNKGIENAAIALARHAAEQKTAIYVLNKQADIEDLGNKFNALSKNSNKPEVHFVKFRTSEDAVNAQKAIQSQYDSLGGSTQSHNGGVAPVLNFASQPAVRTPTAHTPSNAYLPTSVLRRRY